MKNAYFDTCDLDENYVPFFAAVYLLKKWFKYQDEDQNMNANIVPTFC